MCLADRRYHAIVLYSKGRWLACPLEETIITTLKLYIRSHCFTVEHKCHASDLIPIQAITRSWPDRLRVKEQKKNYMANRGLIVNGREHVILINSGGGGREEVFQKSSLRSIIGCPYDNTNKIGACQVDKPRVERKSTERMEFKCVYNTLRSNEKRGKKRAM